MKTTTARQVIEITPKWEWAAAILCAAIEHGNEQAKSEAKAEIKRMARLLDLASIPASNLDEEI